MSDELKIVCVPKDLYYHEIAYVRGLEARIEALETALNALVIRCEFQNGKVRPLDFGVAVKNARAALDKDAGK